MNKEFSLSTTDVHPHHKSVVQANIWGERKSWKFLLTLFCLLQNKVKHMHIYVHSPYSWCIDLSNHTQSLAKRLVIKELQISWVFHDFTSLKEFAHDTWAANEVSHRCEVKKNATHVPLPCCWHRFDPSAGRRAGVDGGVVPMNANKLCLQRRNTPLKSP